MTNTNQLVSNPSEGKSLSALRPSSSPSPRPNPNPNPRSPNRIPGSRVSRAPTLGRSYRRQNDQKADIGPVRVIDQTSSNGRPTVSVPFRQETLKIIPLGGLGEIGKNLTVYELGQDIIVVDAGIMFPDEAMLGIDFVIPDVKYLIERKHRIKGIILTHGHEDHIGGLPYIWPKLEAPMFAGQLTAGMIKIKLDEVGVKNPNISVVSPGEKLKLGPFEIEFIQMAHSIPDDLALFIKTEHGNFLHVTDWKIDHTPIFRQKTDLARFAQLGQEGVTAFLSDSTNAERPGYTLSERVITESFDKIFKDAPGRVVVAMFASQINRIQQVIDVCSKYRRKLAISGRSLDNNINMAMALGYLRVPEGLLTDVRAVNRLPNNEITILATGSQGEEYSALVRMASGEHRQIQIKSGDTVVISASPIPGNEPSVFETIDNLFKLGANVIYGSAVDIHVSGHAHQEELKLLMALAQPKYFIPIHGEYRMLKIHGRLAQGMGVDPDKIFVCENGNVIEFDQGKGKVLETKVAAGHVLVDGLGVGDVGNIVLRDRQAMAKDGIFVVILTIDKKTGQMISSPDIISRGFVYMRAQENLMYQSRQQIRQLFKRHNTRHPSQWEMVKRSIREELGQFLFEKTQRTPMVIPVVIEV